MPPAPPDVAASRSSRRRSPPGGKRSSKAEQAQRLGFVEQELARGRTRREIIEGARSRFGCSERTTDSYLKRARQHAAATRPRSAFEQDRAETVERLEGYADQLRQFIRERMSAGNCPAVRC